MPRYLTAGRALRAVGIAAALSWMCALVFVQWILLMTPSALDFEAATGIRVVGLSHALRAQLSKPLSPPKP